MFFGLVVGKPLGIMLFSFITVKLKIASLPENVNWMHMLGASILGGVGFTMAIFVANLAYDEEVLITAAKLGILIASFVAGVAGFALLFAQARVAEKRGVAYITTHGDDVCRQTAGVEAERDCEDLLEELGDAELTSEIAAVRESCRALPRSWCGNGRAAEAERCRSLAHFVQVGTAPSCLLRIPRRGI